MGKPNGNGNGHGLTGSWLAARLGTQAGRITAMRRAGELYGVRRGTTQEYVYPAWQFDRFGRVRPIVPRLLAAAREAGVREHELRPLLERRLGLVGGGRRIAELVREGEDEQALAVFRAELAAR
jgi:hypothetical protein